MTNIRPRVAIYARFSTDLQNARSAEDQLRVCRDHALRMGWDVVEVYSDLAISGTTNHRPGLNSLLAAAEARAFDIVLAEALDRVSRNQADIATIYQRLQFADVRIHTISEAEVSELHIGMLGTMNALYVKELAAKIRRGQRGAVSRGRVPGGLCYGYATDNRLLPDGTVDRGHRKIVEDEAAIIRRIFAERLAGDSTKAIAQRLNRDGVRGPRGGLWSSSTLSGSRDRANGILHNPAYAGRIVYNRVRMVKDPVTRQRLSRSNKVDERVEEVAEQLRIIDEADWQAIQADRVARAHIPWHRQTRPKHMLSGLVRCARCGGSFTVVSKDRWACRNHRETGTCDNPRRIATADLEHRVMDGLQRQLLAPDVVAKVVKRYHDKRADQRRAMAQGLRGAEKAVDDGRAAIGRLVAAMADGMDMAEVRDELAKRREALAIAEAQLAEHQALPPIILHPQIVEQYRRRIAMIGDAVVKGERAAKFLPVIRGLIDSIAIDDDPAEPNSARVDVLGSLAAVLRVATGEPVQDRHVRENGPGAGARRISTRTVGVVAEEGLEPPTPGL